MISAIAPIGPFNGVPTAADQQSQPTQTVAATAPPPPAEPADTRNASNNENGAGTNGTAQTAQSNDGPRRLENGAAPDSVNALSENTVLPEEQALQLSRAAAASVLEATTPAKEDQEAYKTAMAKEAFTETREINRMAEAKAATTMRERL